MDKTTMPHTLLARNISESTRMTCFINGVFNNAKMGPSALFDTNQQTATCVTEKHKQIHGGGGGHAGVRYQKTTLPCDGAQRRKSRPTRVLVRALAVLEPRCFRWQILVSYNRPHRKLCSSGGNARAAKRANLQTAWEGVLFAKLQQ